VLAGEQGGALGDHASETSELLDGVRIGLGEQPTRCQHEATEGCEDRLAEGSLADRAHQLVLERVHPPVDEVLFGAEVVEDGRLRDIGEASDLGDGDVIEPTLGEEPPGGLRDQLVGLVLLALTPPQRQRSIRACRHMGGVTQTL
jgi:hypothetical protein